MLKILIISKGSQTGKQIIQSISHERMRKKTVRIGGNGGNERSGERACGGAGAEQGGNSNSVRSLFIFSPLFHLNGLN